jgi:hypothetical protein
MELMMVELRLLVTEHGISDVKSIYGTNNGVIGINTFSADVVQSSKFNVGIATISPLSGGVSTIKSSNASVSQELL